MRCPKPSPLAPLLFAAACAGGPEGNGALSDAPGFTEPGAENNAGAGSIEPPDAAGDSGAPTGEPVNAPGPDDEMNEPVAVPSAPPPDDTLIEEAPVEGPSNCEREFEFQAVELGDPEPFDVIIVADHSDSLSWSRDDLASGLSELLLRVSGAEARFFVLTPTQYGVSSGAAKSLILGNDLVNWTNPVTGEPYEDAVTEYVSVCTTSEGAARECPEYPVVSEGEFTLEGRWEFQMPEPIARLTPDMSPEQVAEQQEAISSAILNLSGSGSLQEQPLCTLNRYVTQPQEALPQNALFVLLSDEDDITTPRDCLASYLYEREERPNTTIQIGCTSGCDGYRYRALAPRPRHDIEYRCTPVDDQGNPFPDQAVEGSIVSNAAELCTEVTSSPCRDTDLNRVKQECGSDVLIECALVCTPDASNTTCFLDFEVEMDCSTPFEYGGTQYSDFLDYCTQRHQIDTWTSCERVDGYWIVGDSTSFASTESVRPLVSGSLTEDLVRHFRTVADQVFANGSYYVEVIGFLPSFSCELGDGQSYATTLSTLASSPQDVFPICESYAPALDRIESFASTLLETVYALPLSEYEEIESVRVANPAGQERELAEGDYRYDDVTQTLILRPEALTPRDVSLTVEVARNCVPKAR